MTAEQILFDQTKISIYQKADLIWSTADILVGPYKPHEYGNVILPMTVIKRLHDTLLPTKEAVLNAHEQFKSFGLKDAFLCKASGYKFFNTSKFTFQSLLDDPNNIHDNFEAYLSGFSDNVQDILVNFNFENEITKMTENNLLYLVIQNFNSSKAYFGPDVVSTVDMGYVFEELVRRFSESINEDAGAHFTSRDIIYTMTDLILANHDFTSNNKSFTVYDMAMGTSQMLTSLKERILQLDNDANVLCFGQEINAATYAIAKSDTLVTGGEADNMKLGDTLANDQFKGFEFSAIISNPPFGIDWKRSKSAVDAEFKLGPKGRFSPGLPTISDSQMLFLLNGVAKLKPTGRMAIIQNGSSLFTGDAGSGPSEIRRYIIKNDLLEAIIQLPNDSFYNTGISTYIWVITKAKDEKRIGKVQLIDASKCFEKRRKSIGSKRNDITESSRKLILKAYDDFADKEYQDGTIACESKVFDNLEFGYAKIVVESPQIDEKGKVIKKKGNPVADTSKRDTESIPLKEDIDTYFQREVLPYNPQAWIDRTKTKIGYEIPFTRYFYKYVAPRPSETIMQEILELEKKLDGSLQEIFHE
jgi:type I restriction enzyme M protein